MSRADRLSLEAKKQEVYSDFLTNFDLNPITGLLARVSNEDSVGQSMRNLAMTITGERFYDSNKGSKINYSLFELMDYADSEIMKLQIRDMYRTYEPRAIIHDIRSGVRPDSNALDVTIVYSCINIPDQVYTINFTVRNIR